MRKLFLYANYYYNMGFNVNYIDPAHNKINKPLKKQYKAPSNDYSNLHYKRQTLDQLCSYDWENATGIGAVLGFNKLRALDFDVCNDVAFILEALRILGLPANYEWVAKTGSGNGFHIYFYADDHNFQVKPDRTKAFIPNSEYSGKFARLEMRWEKHIVLPPLCLKVLKTIHFLIVNYP